MKAVGSPPTPMLPNLISNNQDQRLKAKILKSPIPGNPIKEKDMVKLLG
jgi:hypothetical protein